MSSIKPVKNYRVFKKNQSRKTVPFKNNGAVSVDRVFSVVDLDVIENISDHFLRYLCVRVSNSLLPELYSIIGPEKFMEVLNVFAGATLKFPSIERTGSILRDWIIFQEARLGYSKVLIAQRHGVTLSTVKGVVSRCSKFLKEFQLELNRARDVDRKRKVKNNKVRPEEPKNETQENIERRNEYSPIGWAVEDQNSQETEDANGQCGSTPA